MRMGRLWHGADTRFVRMPARMSGRHPCGLPPIQWKWLPAGTGVALPVAAGAALEGVAAGACAEPADAGIGAGQSTVLRGVRLSGST
jgi:hypothetical protein